MADTFGAMLQGTAAYLLLGGNEGDPEAMLGEAEQRIGQRCGRVLARSRDHWTEPWGFRDERLFLNRAILVDTTLAPEDLLSECLEIEKELGRVRTGKGPGPRPIDIDLLLYGSIRVECPFLTVPHPRMHERAFALAPLADIAPDLCPPGNGRSILELLDAVKAGSA